MKNKEKNKNIKIAIVACKTNKFTNEKLLKGAVEALETIGKIKRKNIKIIWIPGSYDIPLISKLLAKKKTYKSIIVISTIIKGETSQYKYISYVCLKNISNISIKYNIPITSAILITETLEQAINRSGMKQGNKGYEAAISSIDLINTINNL
ncbi:MAG: 6,7-dimethyl-8-ribityllumazine synthase [Enterobacteriaceae bacterium]